MNTFELLQQQEEDLYYLIIDLLSHEYHWQPEYIEQLPLDVVVNLIKCIRIRQDQQDVFTQLNVAKAFSGKIEPNRTRTKVPETNEQDSLVDLLKMLGKADKIPNNKKEQKVIRL